MQETNFHWYCPKRSFKVHGARSHEDGRRARNASILSSLSYPDFFLPPPQNFANPFTPCRPLVLIFKTLNRTCAMLVRS
jgi:hypothetical protein